MLSTWMRWFPFHSNEIRSINVAEKLLFGHERCAKLCLYKSWKWLFLSYAFLLKIPFMSWGNLCYELITLSLLFYYMDDGWNVLEIFLRFSSSLPPYPFFLISISSLSHAFFLYFILQQFLMLILWMWKYDEWDYIFIEIPSFFLSYKTKFI